MRDEDFLKQLTEVTKEYGWKGDYSEIVDFVRWCHEEKYLLPFNEDDFDLFKDDESDDDNLIKLCYFDKPDNNSQPNKIRKQINDSYYLLENK